MKSVVFIFALALSLQFQLCRAQASYGAVAAYGTRKIIPAYTGQALQVRRSCDNATVNIGFTSCGNLDTVAMKTFVLASNPLSVISSSTDATYSLRKMYCSYNGFAIRVRSSAVGTPTADIGFTQSGDLDTIALKSFVGSNSAFVTTWYDQSPNAYHGTQSTAGFQPRIVNAGVVDKQNGRPALYFDGADDVLQNNSYSMLLNNQSPTWNAVFIPNATNDTYAAIVCWRYAGGIESALETGPGNNWNTSWWANTNYNLTNGLPITNGSCQILTSLYNATGNTFYINGALSYSNTGQSNPPATATNPNGCASVPLLIGNDNCCGGRFIKGYLYEIVLSSTNFSNTDRQFLEWSQSQYYSVSGPLLTTFPAGIASASVSTWFDQSGTGKDAVQFTAANQPRIINAGIIEKNGTTPALSFAGFPQNLVAPLSTSLYPVSVSVLGNTSGNSANGAFFKLGTSVNGGQAGIALGIGNSGGTFDNAGTSVIGLKEWVVWSPSNPNVNFPSAPFTSLMIQQAGSGGTNAYINGTDVPLSNAGNGVGASMAGNLFIGGYANGSNRYASVKESEVIVLPTALSRTARSLLETQQAAYNTITVSTNKYSPPTANSYNLFVTGVGRESATDSVSGNRSTAGLGFIVGQGGTDFLKDNGDYVTVGVNCPYGPAFSILNLPATVVQRWNNDWYLNKTDIGSNNGTINLFFDFSDYGMPGLPGVPANYELLSRNSPSGNFTVVPVTTKSVLGDRVVFTVDASNIPTTNYYTIGSTNTVTSILPIELLLFEAVCEDGKLVVSWTTASQFHNDYFTIERSLNGIDFDVVSVVKGEGTTSARKNYSVSDDNPFNGITYYRLKQTDVDGAEKIFRAVAVTCENVTHVIKIYPNPSTGIVTLDGAERHSNLLIFNSLGMAVYEATDISAKHKVDLIGLPAGIYFLVVKNGMQKHSFKIIKQD